jgi:hypothetical protein
MHINRISKKQVSYVHFQRETNKKCNDQNNGRHQCLLDVTDRRETLQPKIFCAVLRFVVVLISKNYTSKNCH